ncbi:catabolite control protein A [Paenibacillus sp. JCM 10914]|uniref:LacI family DNA-binding transcriptional regulator n=1 Tax=Paenibacillus sp. JCM 10914 TaxID=1236974 RepID=UPI0003CC4F4C|nr:LacI family DNA-binding transcriptional regulator [Paenibacillus sp. JCM 10914]GAE08445.1 catabolite control protein A [Paenibacillus sp. JCM 10914]
MDIKIKDVAKAANVSVATVSRVLNNSGVVTERTRLKVQEAIESMNYHPNATAKFLRSKKTMMIGVIVSDINVSYYAEIVKGIENMAYSREYKVIICDAHNQKEEELGYLELLLNRTVDAMILVSMTGSISDELIGELADKGYNIGVVGKCIDHAGVPCIFTDNVKFSMNVVHHFIEQGHRSIAFLSGYPDALDSYERLEGYMKALREHRLPFRQELIENGDFNEKGGYHAFLRLIGKGLPFTAVYSANDEMALGVYRACAEMGITIPKDLAIVGVDNNRISRYITPRLSTVDQPKYAMGALITEKLIDQMNENQFKEQRVFKVDSELLVRESSRFAK